MFWIFSNQIACALQNICLDKLNEIRVRNGLPIKILVADKWGYLSNQGFSISSRNAIKADKNEAQNIAVKASENSLYSVCDDISKGFLTLSNGCRIGLCGECVNINDKVKTFKNFTSATIRIPHQIFGASNSFFNYIHTSEMINNTLIVSPPGGGKTTVLRDIAQKLSFQQNTLIIDERYEIASIRDGMSVFNIGESDVISGCNKKTAIENSIRSCAPNVIITDEISEEDYEPIRLAVSCGVNIITSIHASSIENLLKKPNFENFFSNKIFDLFIVLQGRENPGKCVGIFNANLERIY
ncbi:MAG: stage III sporulation protein AA [Clostridiales bacterium]|nr:stage III sporulation protein AA [Clostridiales bacterium]